MTHRNDILKNELDWFPLGILDFHEKAAALPLGETIPNLLLEVKSPAHAALG